MCQVSAPLRTWKAKSKRIFSPFLSLFPFHRMGAHGEIGGKEWKRNRTLEEEQVDEVDGATPTSSESLVNQLGQVTGCFLASTFATYHTRRATHGTSVPHTQSEVRVCQERAAKGSADRQRILIGTCASKAAASTPRRPSGFPIIPEINSNRQVSLFRCHCIVSIG